MNLFLLTGGGQVRGSIVRYHVGKGVADTVPYCVWEAWVLRSRWLWMKKIVIQYLNLHLQRHVNTLCLPVLVCGELVPGVRWDMISGFLTLWLHLILSYFTPQHFITAYCMSVCWFLRKHGPPDMFLDLWNLYSAWSFNLCLKVLPLHLVTPSHFRE